MTKTAAQSCPSPQTLSRAFNEGPSEALRGHMAGCPQCAEAWAGFDGLRALGRQLPVDVLTPHQVEDVRNGLLARAKAGRVPARTFEPTRWLAAAAFVFIMLLAALILSLAPWGSLSHEHSAPDHKVRAYRAVIHPHGDADYMRAGEQPHELVRLAEGRLTIEVHGLGQGERFVVVTGDAEVEVRGTVFDVEAKGDKLVAVRVIEGKVEVRPEEGAQTLLAPGERWRAPSPQEASVPAEPDPAPAVARTPDEPDLSDLDKPRAKDGPPVPRRGRARITPNRRRDPEVQGREVPESDKRPPVEPSASERAFKEGWRALKAGDHDKAARAFESAAKADDERLAEDAAFWRAVALKRAGQDEVASEQMSDFVRRHPGSPRVGSASVMLGWQALGAGDLEAARRHFDAASDDPDPKVRGSARAGLEQIGSRRKTKEGPPR